MHDLARLDFEISSLPVRATERETWSSEDPIVELKEVMTLLRIRPHVGHRIERASSSGLVTAAFRQKHDGAEQE